MKIIIYSILLFTIFLGINQTLFSQNYWTRLDGPYGGNVVELKKHSSGNFYALRNSGLFMSSNSGDSWNEVNEMSVNSNLSMEISPSGVIYVGKSSGGLWWTANLGQSWSFNPIHIAPHSGLWTSVIITKISPSGNIFINSHVSFNGGLTFTQFTDNSIGVSSDYAFSSSNHVYSASYNGIFYSVNNGSAWTNINGNLPSVTATSLMFDNNVLIAGINGGGIFRTSDNGINWEARNNGISDLSIKKIHKDSQNNYYSGTFSGKIFKSTNGGNSWIEILNSTDNAINAVYTEGNSIYLASSALGILKSTNNGLSWTEKNKNLFLSGINSLAFSGNNEIYAASYSGFLYSPDNGNSWERRNSALPSLMINSIYKSDNGDLFAGVNNLGIYRSSDNGNSWLSSNNGIEAGGVIKQIKKSANGFMFAASMPGFFVDTIKLYRSSDNGGTWTKILQPEATGFSEFTIDGSGVLYVAGTGASFQTEVMKSTDNGNSWSKIVLTQFLIIDNLAAYGSNLYMTSSQSVYKSTDEGESWNQLNNGGWQSSLSDLEINSIGKIFVSSGNAVYVTSNDGTNWIQENSGLFQNTSINNLLFDHNEFLYGITYYEGIFKSVRSTLTSVNSNVSNGNLDYKLEQNYPNPFNPSTIIRYMIPTNVNGQMSNVKLLIYDVLGKEVAALVNEKQSGGSYEVKFIAGNLPSGVYYYKLQTENFEKVMKMILLK